MNSEAPIKKKEKMRNPFVFIAPVRGADFFNRDEIIKVILEYTVTGKGQGNVWITGERQVGKTSLLRYIQSSYEDYNEKIQLYQGREDEYNVAFIYLNAQDNKTRGDFFASMQQSLKNFFDFKLENIDDPFENFLHSLKYLFFEQKYYIVFLVDEFDAFIENLSSVSVDTATSFLSDLNKLIQGVSRFKNEPKVFGCIFAANHTIDELLNENIIGRRGSGLVLESLELEEFSKAQVKELANLYLENNPIQFSEDEIDFCFKLTKGYPYFVQKLFSIMYKQRLKRLESNEYLKKVKKEYARTFEETIKGWGGKEMPKRTFEKIIKLIGDKSLALVFESIKEYMKMQINA